MEAKIEADRDIGGLAGYVTRSVYPFKSCLYVQVADAESKAAAAEVLSAQAETRLLETEQAAANQAEILEVGSS
jgi:hypothetical protein